MYTFSLTRVPPVRLMGSVMETGTPIHPTLTNTVILKEVAPAGQLVGFSIIDILLSDTDHILINIYYNINV